MLGLLFCSCLSVIESIIRIACGVLVIIVSIRYIRLSKSLSFHDEYEMVEGEKETQK